MYLLQILCNLLLPMLYLLGLDRISVLAGNAALNAITALVDGGTPPAKLYLRTGARPATTLTADSGTLCSTLTMSNTSFGAASSDVSTAAAITSDTNIAASGTVAHFRIKTGMTAVCIIQGTVDTSGADLNFDNNICVAGGTAAISSFTLTMPIT